MDHQPGMSGSEAQSVQPDLAPQRRHGIPLPGWIAIGCGTALLAVVLIAAAVIFLIAHVGGAHCPPSDFPVPASASERGFNVFVGTGGSSCNVTWDSSDTGGSVDDFYVAHLSEGNWTITDREAQTGVISFKRVTGNQVTGQIRISGHGTSSTIEVRFFSSSGSFGP
jgi:hypothetical protein